MNIQPILPVLIVLFAIFSISGIVLTIIVAILETKFTTIERETLRTSAKSDMKIPIVLGGLIAIGVTIYYGIYYAFINLEASILELIIHLGAVYLTYLIYLILIRIFRYFIKLL